MSLVKSESGIFGLFLIFLCVLSFFVLALLYKPDDVFEAVHLLISRIKDFLGGF